MCKQTKKRNGFLGILLTLAMVFTLLPVVPAKADLAYDQGNGMYVLTDGSFVEQLSEGSEQVCFIFSKSTMKEVQNKKSVSYDKATNTLTLDGYDEAHLSIHKACTVLLKGDNYVRNTQDSFCVDYSITLKAEAGATLTVGKLYIEKGEPAWNIPAATLTLDPSVTRTDNTDGSVVFSGPKGSGSDNPGNTDPVSKLPAVKDKLDAKDGSATYEVTKSANGAVEVAYTGPSAAQKKKTSITVKGQVTLKDGTKAKVTSVAPKAFKGNKKVKTITLDKNIVKVGKDACNGCTSLTTLTIKNKNIKIAAKAFKNAGKKGKKVKVVYPKAIKKGKALTKFKKMIKNAGLKKVTYKAK